MRIPEELCDSIISRNCVLFVGAGASMEAGAPSSQELAQQLSQKYLQGQHQGETLSRIAAYIEAKPGLGRTVVIDYLINRLSVLEPGKAHLLLPKFDWAAIYTTNYDTLIEQAYETIGTKCKPIVSSLDLTVDMTDTSQCVLLYKPHGCISRPSSRETPIVITEDDYHSAADGRKAIYRQLEVHRYRSVFLFVGYSFSDFDLSQIWFDVSAELGRLSRWAYALWPKCSEVQRSMWQGRNVELIDTQFGEFIRELESISVKEKKDKKLSISNTDVVELAKVLLSAMEARDPYMKGHSLRVQKLSLVIAGQMAFPTRERRLLEVAALFHDIGFLAVPDYVTAKDKLMQSEWEVTRQHPIVGERLLSSVASLRNTAKIVRCHHERYDGEGYPDGHSGKAIPLSSRIIALADAYDAMTSDRPYRKAMTREEAIDEVKSESGKQFDPDVVQAFLGGK